MTPRSFNVIIIIQVPVPSTSQLDETQTQHLFPTSLPETCPFSREPYIQAHILLCRIQKMYQSLHLWIEDSPTNIFHLEVISICEPYHWLKYDTIHVEYCDLLTLLCSRLHFIFEKNLERALRILDQGGVQRVVAQPSERSVFQVRSFAYKLVNP